jgi:hypothetical protein
MRKHEWDCWCPSCTDASEFRGVKEQAREASDKIGWAVEREAELLARYPNSPWRAATCWTMKEGIAALVCALRRIADDDGLHRGDMWPRDVQRAARMILAGLTGNPMLSPDWKWRP